MYKIIYFNNNNTTYNFHHLIYNQSYIIRRPYYTDIKESLVILYKLSNN